MCEPNDNCETCVGRCDIGSEEPVCVNCGDQGCEFCEPEDDGQPSEYDEWQDVYGGDDWDHGQYDDH